MTGLWLKQSKMEIKWKALFIHKWTQFFQYTETQYIVSCVDLVVLSKNGLFHKFDKEYKIGFIHHTWLW